MEPPKCLDKVKEFLKMVKEQNPAPVPLEKSEEGPYIKMELSLGIFDVGNPDQLQFNEPAGEIIPELCDYEEPDPRPMIEDITPSTKKRKRLRKLAP
jgi:hypothetical protein